MVLQCNAGELVVVFFQKKPCERRVCEAFCAILDAFVLIIVNIMHFLVK